MDLTTQQLLEKAVALHASDIFIVAGRPASIRLNGSIIMENTERLMPDDTQLLLKQIYQLAGDRDMDTLIRTGDDDFSFSVQNLSRFRVSASNSADLFLPLSVSFLLIFRIAAKDTFQNASLILPIIPRDLFW